jgi:putative Mg2+ transporter-C (MgtC) family protein
MKIFEIPNSLSSDAILILIAVVLGVLIGAEREYQNKSAGLRTFILVSFGACLFTIISVKTGIQNPDRIAANIVTGVGFLGAGVIWHEPNRISGITTATSIWATASIGLCVGTGQIYLAVIGTVLVLFTLRTLSYVEFWFDALHKVREYQITLAKDMHPNEFQNHFKAHGLKSFLLRESASEQYTEYTWKVSGKNRQHLSFVETLRKDKKIQSYTY